MSLWKFTNYKAYLTSRLDAEGSRSGLRKKLAEAIPVHSTFVSQVLNGLQDFSPEQAEAINTFFDHSEDEGEYFVLLVLKDRSTNQKLKSRFDKRIKSMREDRMNIKNRIKASDSISQKDREKFYSSSVYGALHVLSSIPQFQSLPNLADALKLSKSRTREALDFMIGIGLIVERNGKIESGTKHIHIGNESELILKHHCNWRQHAISNLQFLNKEDVHYSGCWSLSIEDAYKIKESILQNLKENVNTVSKSKEEIAYVMNVDFYKLTS